MSTLDELKSQWKQADAQPASYDEGSFRKLIKARVHQHTRSTMQFFWASFTLQLMVYALLSHVLIKYGRETPILLLSIAGMLLYLPFTIVLMQKFKRFAVATAKGNDVTSVREYLLQQYALLESFFLFKKRYERVLIPLVSAIGVFLVFALYFPGGVVAYPIGASVTYLLTLLSCYLAIRSENRKSFIQPLAQLRAILDDYREEIHPPTK